MVTHLADLFPMILAAAATSMVISPLAIRVSSKLGLVDLPWSAPHKQHHLPVPSVGGLVLIISILVAYLLVRPMVDQEVIGIFISAGLMMIWGVLDDRYNLAPYQKLIGQTLATIVLIIFGVQVHITRLPWFDLVLTSLWMIGLVNAFNFVDSMDGLAIGLASIAAAFFMMVTIDSSQPILATLAASILGATAGVFYFNASPARMFLGDSGSQFLGFLLAAMGIAYVPAQAGLPQGVSWFTPILVLGVPIFDTTLVMFSRLRRKKPIYQAERDHTYHRLVAIGLDPARSVLTMQLVAVVLGLTAFIALDASVLVANIIFAGIVLSGAILLGILEYLQETGPR